MARKSKRGNAEETATFQTPQICEKLPTAAYARLSVEKDGDESIRTQISMLHQYIVDHEGLTLAETYVDNGFSGTDFERPDFKRMMEDVYSGKIRCIVVKDLSRFGRNLVETGNYIENIFPKLDVRFIAVTDNFDSSRQEDRNSIALPIRNMVNAMYARDFSKKQTIYFEQHSRIGDIKIQRAPYGYTVDKQKNILIPDPVTAPVVQMVFRWFLLGVKMDEIAKRMNDRKIPSLYGYQVQTNGYTDMKHFNEHADVWRHSSVYQILRCDAYKGDRVLGKKRKIMYKGILAHRAPQEEWIIHENMHEALVPASDFDAIRAVLSKRTAEHKQRMEAFSKRDDLPIDYFKGKVWCMECGRRLIYERKSQLSDKEHFHGASYKCYDGLRVGETNEAEGRRTHGKAYHGSKNKDGSRRDCGKKVHEDFVKITVLDAVQNLLHTLCDGKQAAKQLKSSKGGRFYGINRECLSLHGELRTLQSRLEGLYGDFVSELLTSDEYMELKEHFIAEEQSIKEKLRVLDEEQRRMEKVIDNFLAWSDKLEWSSLANRELEQNLLNELVERVSVGDNYEVEVQFKCADVIEEMSHILNEGE